MKILPYPTPKTIKQGRTYALVSALTAITVLHWYVGGVLTLTGVGNAPQSVQIDAGSIALGGAGTLGSGTYSGPISISSGCSFVHGSSANTIYTGIISGAGTFVISSGAQINIGGASNSNTIAGGITVSGAGVKLVNNTGASATINCFGTGTLSVLNSAQCSLNGYNCTSANPSLVVLGAGAMMYNAVATPSAFPSTTPVVLTGNATTQSASTAGTLTISGTIDLGGFALTGNVTQSGGNLVWNGIVSNGGITKTGAGKLTLGSTNTYTGVTAVQLGTVAVTAATKINAASRCDITVSNATPTATTNSGLITWGAAPAFAGKTLNIIITESGTGITYDACTWTGTATGAPTVQVNGVTLTLTGGVGTTAGGTTVTFDTTNLRLRVTR